MSMKRAHGSFAALRRVLAFCLFTLFTSQLAITQESVADEPSWLTYERGLVAFDRREFGEALLLFRTVKAANSSMPEVDIQIGRVFEAEGEMDLALLQYERALERRELLIVPGDAISLQYRIASILASRDQLLEYEQMLQSIITEIDGSYTLPPTDLEDPMYRVLTTDGIRKLLELYRIEDRGSQTAYDHLARLLLYDGRRYIEATRSACFSVVMTVTELIEFARYLDPEYQFTGIEPLVKSIDRFRYVRDYLEQTDFYGQLFTLGQALYSSDRFATAEEIRNILIRNDAGMYGRRAARGYDSF